MPTTTQADAHQLAAVCSVPWSALIVGVGEQIADGQSGIAAEVLAQSQYVEGAAGAPGGGGGEEEAYAEIPELS